MFISQCELKWPAHNKSNYKPVSWYGGRVNCYMVSVTPVCAIFYGHTLSIKDGAYRRC